MAFNYSVRNGLRKAAIVDYYISIHLWLIIHEVVTSSYTILFQHQVCLMVLALWVNFRTMSLDQSFSRTRSSVQATTLGKPKLVYGTPAPKTEYDTTKVL